MNTIEKYVTPASYTIAGQIMFFRKHRKLSQADLGKICGMDQSAIARLESTPDVRWTANTLAIVAAALDVRVNFNFVPDEANADK